MTTPRYQRIMEAHPFLQSGEVRAMLCIESRKLESLVNGRYTGDDMQQDLDSAADVLISLDEKRMRGYLEEIKEIFSDQDLSQYNDVSKEEIEKLEANYAKDD